jgi:DNA-binding MarR family transcriptional regulator
MTDLAAKAKDIAENCACMKARHTARTLSRLYDEHLRPLGIQASQLTVLVAVVRFGDRGAPFGALADAIGMDRSTLTRNLVPLERDGHLRVARDPDDARQRVVLLTKDGARTLERAYPLWQRAQKEIADALGVRATAELSANLERAVDALPGATRAKRAPASR